MHRSIAASLLLVVAITFAAAWRAFAYPELARKTKSACASCHVNPAGGAELSAAGKAYKTSPKKPPAPVAGPEYVGANRCRSCHPQQHTSWSGTAHAQSMHTLRTADAKDVARFATKLKIELKAPPAETDACVVCHVAGFKLPGGYPAPDSTKNAALAAVGCESCHGPGSRHVVVPLAEKKKFITRNLTEKLCVSCHTPLTSPEFEFAAYHARGVHPVKTD